MAGSETRRKTATTTLRLDLEELASLRAVADAAGLGPSSFLRNLALQAIGEKPKARPRRGRRDRLATVVAEVLGELGRIGNNLNQIAKVANATGNTSAATSVGDMREEVERLTREILSLRESPPA